jgi:hypothetical protein
MNPGAYSMAVDRSFVSGCPTALFHCPAGQTSAHDYREILRAHGRPWCEKHPRSEPVILVVYTPIGGVKVDDLSEAQLRRYGIDAVAQRQAKERKEIIKRRRKPVSPHR